jgi:hypothetical protein
LPPGCRRWCGGLVVAGDALGQLLIGRAHAGYLTVHELAKLRQLLVNRHRAGLIAEGLNSTTEDDVRAGLDGSLLLWNAFSSLPLRRLSEPITEELRLLMA